MKSSERIVNSSEILSSCANCHFDHEYWWCVRIRWQDQRVMILFASLNNFLVFLTYEMSTLEKNEILSLTLAFHRYGNVSFLTSSWIDADFELRTRTEIRSSINLSMMIKNDRKRTKESVSSDRRTQRQTHRRFDLTTHWLSDNQRISLNFINKMIVEKIPERFQIKIRVDRSIRRKKILRLS